MKKLRLIGLLMILASSLMFIQCTSDPIPGTAGIDGVDGIDGADGADGVGVQECIDCHSNDNREPIEASFLLSKHSTESPRTGSDGSCAACHSQEGYFAQLEGTFDAANYVGAVLTKKTCTTCHNKHSTFDFETDGYDFALRSFGPVALTQMPGETIDFDNTSNMCVQCHQPRDPEPTFDTGGLTLTVTSSNRGMGPHYGVNATFLKGIQGYPILGDVAIPGTDANPHLAASCTKCHMGDPNTNSQEGFGYDANGSHTFNPTLIACIKCHEGLTTFDRNGFQTEILALEEQLKDLMFAKNMAVMGTRRPELIEGQVLPRAYVEIFWNYASVTSDHSHGIHNPPYTEAMLKNAIQKLNSLPAIP